MRGARFGALLLAGACAGCPSLRFERDVRYLQPDEESVSRIQVGQSGLEDCLRLLGSPLFVKEYGQGMALYWGWSRRGEYGLSVDVPMGSNGGASVSYADADLARKGLLILLDGELRVELVRHGLLADLLSTVARRRPQYLGATEEDQK